MLINRICNLKKETLKRIKKNIIKKHDYLEKLIN